MIATKIKICCILPLMLMLAGPFAPCISIRFCNTKMHDGNPKNILKWNQNLHP